MLGRDAEEILKVLIRLYKEIQSFRLVGDYELFPEKYQNVIPNLFEKLEQNELIYGYTLFLGGDFMVNLSPDALTYFEDKAKAEKSKQI